MIEYEPSGKRLLDICLSAMAITLFSPLFIVIAIFIKTESNGPVFFKQIRIGRNFKPFCLIKFRTMICEQQTQYGQFEPGDQSRITRLGRLLRDAKVDELPELFNVIKGDMSIIGPRPEVPKIVERFKKQYKKILVVKPGLSDSASIKYRNEGKILRYQQNPEKFYDHNILPDKLKMAKIYIRRVSFTYDLALIVATIVSVLKNRKE